MSLMEGNCEVYIGGNRLPDGRVGDSLLDPTALAGLQVTWGRDNSLDQPEAATCNFEVMLNPDGTAPFGINLAVGSTVSVEADVVSDNTGATIVEDPEFSLGTKIETRVTPSQYVEAAWSTTRRTGVRSAAIRWTSTASGVGAKFSPIPFLPGQSPGQMRYIPPYRAGERWNVGVWIRGVPGQTISLQAAFFADPTWGWPTTTTNATSGGTTSWTKTLTGEWDHFVVESAGNMQADGRHVGVGVSWKAPLITDPGSWGVDQDVQTLLVDSIEVIAPATTTPRATVFRGRITALKNSWNDETGTPVLSVTCADFSADLENTLIGDTPWPVQTWLARGQAILAATPLGPKCNTIPETISPDITVAARDVDAQPAMTLLREIGTSVDAAVWPVTTVDYSGATTGSLYFEDISARLPLARMVPGQYDIDACRVLRDRATWVQDTQDVSTRTSVAWTDDATDPDNATQRRTEDIDTAIEALLGPRRISISTQLRTEADAQRLAASVLSRTRFLDWRLQGVTLDTYALNIDPDNTSPALARMLYTLLHSATRAGLPLRLTDLPPWSPAEPFGAYTEGGKYTFENGAWTLDLDLSRAPGLTVTNLIPNPLPNSNTMWYSTGSSPAETTYPTSGAPGGTTWYKRTFTGPSTYATGFLYAFTPQNAVRVTAGTYYTISADLIYKMADPSGVTTFEPYLAYFTDAAAADAAAAKGLVDVIDDEDRDDDGKAMVLRAVASTNQTDRATPPNQIWPGRTIGPPNTWYRAEITVQPPDTADYVSVRFRINSLAAAVAGDFYGVANVNINAARSPWPFSGDTPDSLANGYDWTGIPDASPSTLSTLSSDDLPPVYGRRNLCRAPRPKSSSGWGASGGTGTTVLNFPSNTIETPMLQRAYDNTDSAQDVSTLAVVRIGITSSTRFMAVEAGKTYAASMKAAYTVQGTVRYELQAMWYDDTNKNLGSTYVRNDDLTVVLMVRNTHIVAGRITAIENATKMGLHVRFLNDEKDWAKTGTSGSTSFFAGAMFITEDLDDTLAFFDGETPSTGAARYSFDDITTVNASSTALYLGSDPMPIDILGNTADPNIPTPAQGAER